MSGLASCCEGACSFAAGVRKLAWRGVSRLQRKPQPEDFPGGGKGSGVCCHGGPGSDVRNMLRWSLVEKTVRSGYGGSVVP